jgi:hypothetical protein
MGVTICMVKKDLSACKGGFAAAWGQFSSGSIRLKVNRKAPVRNFISRRNNSLAARTNSCGEISESKSAKETTGSWRGPGDRGWRQSGALTYCSSGRVEMVKINLDW